MVSSFTLAGLLTAAIVCLALPVGLLIFCVVKNKGERLFLPAMMGFAVMLLAGAFPGLVMSIPLLARLGEDAVVLYILTASVVLGIFDSAARYFVFGFMKRTGNGFYKAFAAGTGMGAGLILIQAGNYFQYYQQARMINNGTFVSQFVVDGGITMEQATEYIQNVSAIHPAEYFVAALEHGTLLLLEIAMALLLAKLFAEGKRVKGFFITAGIRAAYELVTRAVYLMPEEMMGQLLSRTTSKIILFVLLFLIAVASVCSIFRLKPQIPETEGTLGLPPAGARREQEVKQEMSTFQQLRNLNLKTLNEDAEAVEEKEETEKKETE